MNDNDILTACVTQTSEKLAFGCFDVLNSDCREMTLEEFKTLAEVEISLNVDEAEDAFWGQVTKERIYAINNSISLFGDETLIWNLDTFTSDESSIHTKPSHRHLKVSVFQE